MKERTSYYKVEGSFYTAKVIPEKSVVIKCQSNVYELPILKPGYLYAKNIHEVTVSLVEVNNLFLKTSEVFDVLVELAPSGYSGKGLVDPTIEGIEIWLELYYKTLIMSVRFKYSRLLAFSEFRLVCDKPSGINRWYEEAKRLVFQAPRELAKLNAKYML